MRRKGADIRESVGEVQYKHKIFRRHSKEEDVPVYTYAGKDMHGIKSDAERGTAEGGNNRRAEIPNTAGSNEGSGIQVPGRGDRLSGMSAVRSYAGEGIPAILRPLRSET